MVFDEPDGTLLPNGNRLLPDRDKAWGMEHGIMLVRLPRRLSATRRGEPRVSHEDVLRWVRGQVPAGVAEAGRRAVGVGPETRDVFRAKPGDQTLGQLWEREHPRRGLGLPKRLPRRKLRPGYAPCIGIVSDALSLDDGPICGLRGVDVRFNREMVDATRIGDIHMRWGAGRTTAKVTATLASQKEADAARAAVRTAIEARYNGRPNLHASLADVRFAGTIVNYVLESDAMSPRWQLRLDLDMVIIEW